MKTALSVLLISIILAICAGYPPPMAASEEAAVRQRHHEHHEVVIFPGIKPVFRAFNLQVIEAYCWQRGIRQLSKDRVRLFVQPMGVVAEAVEINLMNRQLTVHPGTYDREEVIKMQLSEEQIAQIRTLVTSEEFKRIPAENDLFGADGCAYLVETSIDNAYSWKLHWGLPINQELMKVVDNILSMTVKLRAEGRNATPLILALPAHACAQ